MKKHLSLKKLAVLSVFLFTLVLTVSISASAAQTITRFGVKNYTVSKGKTFELKVQKTSPVNDDDLKWSIKNKNIIAFDELDHYDDDMDFRAIKAGSTTITCKNTRTGEKVTYKVTVKKPNNSNSSAATIQAFGSKNRTVYTGQEFELEVKCSEKTERNLKWTIKDTGIAAFEDPEDESRGDDEVDFIALKSGNTTITCTNTATNEKVTFTIQVKDR